MAKKKSFVIYENWAKLISECPDQQAGQLIKAICDYKLGKEVELENPMVKAAFEMIREALDKDADKYEVTCEKRKEAIEKRWHNKSIEKNTNVSNSIQVDTDTDTETDTDTDNGIKLKENTKRKSAERIVSMYHIQCPSLPKVAKLTEARIKAVNARLKEYSEENIETAFVKAENSPFLRGDNGKWKAGFDWLMNPNNIVKVLEGNYDDKVQQQKDNFDAMLEEWAKGGNDNA